MGQARGFQCAGRSAAAIPAWRPRIHAHFVKGRMRSTCRACILTGPGAGVAGLVCDMCLGEVAAWDVRRPARLSACVKGPGGLRCHGDPDILPGTCGETTEVGRHGQAARATGDGRRATGDGRRATGDGRRATGDGRRKWSAGTGCMARHALRAGQQRNASAREIPLVDGQHDPPPREPCLPVFHHLPRCVDIDRGGVEHRVAFGQSEVQRNERARPLGGEPR